MRVLPEDLDEQLGHHSANYDVKLIKATLTAIGDESSVAIDVGCHIYPNIHDCLAIIDFSSFICYNYSNNNCYCLLFATDVV